jgi:hypothetical protein
MAASEGLEIGKNTVLQAPAWCKYRRTYLLSAERGVGDTPGQILASSHDFIPFLRNSQFQSYLAHLIGQDYLRQRFCAEVENVPCLIGE